MEVKVYHSQEAYAHLLHKHLYPKITGVASEGKMVFDRKAYFFYTNSYQDYLAARLLLNNGMLMQGCIMANTFLEKILKAHILFYDSTFKKRIHNSTELFDLLVEKQPIAKTLLNRSFTEFLAKIYNARYYEALEKDFNVYISYRRTIAELDYSAFVLFNTITFTFPPYDSGSSANPLKGDFLAAELQLLAQNYLLMDLDKTFFIEDFPDKKLEFRIFAQLGEVPIECHAEDIQAYNDEVFDRLGMECDIVEVSLGVYTIAKHYDRDIQHKSLA